MLRDGGSAEAELREGSVFYSCLDTLKFTGKRAPYDGGSEVSVDLRDVHDKALGYCKFTNHDKRLR